ncbi:hypothetical protein GCM10011346_52200 [Oceanobacillus neutriphilus]|uniref:Uncharacterized protein n=1 Tax=Oceanobacillus neutriphilus TaxID=531815 RepID=A0ABQ2P3C5_9BACI|nr:hypothetical protein GCM10011346_52200 [Oceanobacillus neutriphilus]
MRAISIVKHEDKVKFLQICRNKEDEGFICVKPMQHIHSWYEAVYVKKVVK